MCGQFLPVGHRGHGTGIPEATPNDAWSGAAVQPTEASLGSDALPDRSPNMRQARLAQKDRKKSEPIAPQDFGTA